MLHQDVDAVAAELVLADRELLKADIVLEHLSKVYSDRLANGLIHWVINIELFECIIL